MQSERIRYLIVPGWHGSEDTHWQSHWQRTLPNAMRVEQQDWVSPCQEDWIAELDQAIRRSHEPVILIAHSLGCVTVAHWAARTHRSAPVMGALLVAPADVERQSCHPLLQAFAPIPLKLLPFPSVVVTSDNDHSCTPQRALSFAQKWGAETAVIAEAGHINPESGFTTWESGFRYLYRLQYLIDVQKKRTA